MKSSTFLLIFFLTFATGAVAQICDSSSVTYIVRSEKGKPLGADKLDFAKETGIERSSWEIGERAAYRYAGEKPRAELPADVKSAIISTKTLETRRSCNFNGKEVRLTLKLNRKEMTLNFTFPVLSEYEARDFIVDSLPFKAGSYTIKLERTAERQVYYQASGWKKTN